MRIQESAIGECYDFLGLTNMTVFDKGNASVSKMWMCRVTEMRNIVNDGKIKTVVL